MKNREAVFLRLKLDILSFATGCFICAFVAADMAQAQSTLEYTALAEAVTAAAAADKEKPKDSGNEEQGADFQGNRAADVAGEAISKIYGESSEALSARGTALLGRLGGMPQAAEAAVGAQAPGRTAEPRMIEFEGQGDSAAVADEKKDGPEIPAGQGIRIYLKDGHVVEAKRLEEGRDRYRVQAGGVDLTYFKDDIEKTERF
jgi:hypothetical protein